MLGPVPRPCPGQSALDCPHSTFLPPAILSSCAGNIRWLYLVQALKEDGAICVLQEKRKHVLLHVCNSCRLAQGTCASIPVPLDWAVNGTSVPPSLASGIILAFFGYSNQPAFSRRCFMCSVVTEPTSLQKARQVKQ